MKFDFLVCWALIGATALFATVFFATASRLVNLLTMKKPKEKQEPREHVVWVRDRDPVSNVKPIDFD